ncbi:MAG TPA: peroxidase [Syntrophobacteria bacterium]|nr:peroxidase [Syntrophobacteria bacterium]
MAEPVLARPTAGGPGVDYGDVQGLVRFGYSRMTEACFFLLAVRDPASARSWLATAPVADAVGRKPPPATAMQVAFTAEGLRALGVPAALIEGFAPEFISGMAGEESRSRRLGDVGANAPTGWRWGGPGRVPHLLVLLYAEPGRLADWQRTIQGERWAAAFQEIECLTTSNLDGTEPFGFKDGISQPVLDWDRERRVEGDQLGYSNLLALGEFLLGYPNEYGKYTERPLVKESDDPRRELLPAEDAPGRRDLGRNGTYLVFRELRQDVLGFWRFLDRQANSNAAERQRLAEAMVGRRMSGESLVPAGGPPIAGVGPDPEDTRQNQFTYASDEAGTRCPFGAHIRRANPRNADLPGGTGGLLSRLIRILGFRRQGIRGDLVASTRFHRILRRGREYGPGLALNEALRLDRADGVERGLHFICLNANISRQFEFVQNAWIMGTKFNGLTGESDPLLGNREPIPGCPRTDGFSTPRENTLPRRITGMPQFVTVRGGGYFFMPGLRALRYIAASPITKGDKKP